MKNILESKWVGLTGLIATLFFGILSLVLYISSSFEREPYSEISPVNELVFASESSQGSKIIISRSDGKLI